MCKYPGNSVGWVEAYYSSNQCLKQYRSTGKAILCIFGIHNRNCVTYIFYLAEKPHSNSELPKKTLSQRHPKWFPSGSACTFMHCMMLWQVSFFKISDIMLFKSSTVVQWLAPLNHSKKALGWIPVKWTCDGTKWEEMDGFSFMKTINISCYFFYNHWLFHGNMM